MVSRILHLLTSVSHDDHEMMTKKWRKHDGNDISKQKINKLTKLLRDPLISSLAQKNVVFITVFYLDHTAPKSQKWEKKMPNLQTRIFGIRTPWRFQNGQD